MLLLLVLSTMILGSQVISEKCGRSPSLKFSVSSWRNESGHRLVAADVRSGSSDKESVSLAVELLSEKCGDSRSVILKTLSSTRQPEEQASVSTTVDPAQPEEQASVSTTVDPAQSEEQMSASSTEASTQSEAQTSVSSTIAPTVLPLPGYHHIPGFGYYKKLPDFMKWKDGVEACRKEGTRMWLVESQEEIDAVVGWAGQYEWVGVHRESSSGPWINVLGRQMNSADFFGWLPGYPSGETNCMRTGYGSSRGGTYNYGCESTWPVICEQIL